MTAGMDTYWDRELEDSRQRYLRNWRIRTSLERFRRPGALGVCEVDVLRHIDRELARVPLVEDAVTRLQVEAERVAAGQGHELGVWYQTDGLLTAARCTRCTATVCLREEGCGSNDAPLRWISHPCAPVLERFYVVCSTPKGGFKTFFVRDRESPMLGALFMTRKMSTAREHVRRLNAVDANGSVAVTTDAALVKMRAKVDRLRRQLVAAEGDLARLQAQD